MSPQEFLASFHEIANAPGGVARLREVVLHLAVTGHLVTQVPEDGHASELLRVISEERSHAVRDGIANRSKPQAEAAASELSYPLPPTWSAARISDIVLEIQTGPFGSSLHKQDYQSGGTPVINPASIQNGLIVPIEDMAIGPATLARLEVFKLREGDIVMARRGEMGRCAVVTNKEDGWLCGTGSLMLRMPKVCHAPFIAMLVGSPDSRRYLGGASVGTTMQNLNQSILSKMMLGLPPLAEQKRIVAKVEELMALCDALEAQQQERDRLFPRLSRATHTRLTDSPSQPHLESLFTDLGSISPEDMRRTILEMVVAGPFTPDAHVREVNLGDVITLISGQHLLADEQNDQGKGMPYITGPADFGAVSPEPKRWTETPKVVAEPGDIVITVKGAGVGKTNLVVEEPLAISRQLMAVRVRDTEVNEGFIHLVLQNAASHFQSLMTGIAIPGIGRRDVLELKTALPSLTEQRRIVAQVEELMALVATLEAQQQEKSHLAEAFAQACVASITGTRIETRERMKAPKTQLVSRVRLGSPPPDNANAPLAKLISKSSDNEMDAKALWQQSKLSIDDFYLQLRSELDAGWIAQPSEAQMIDLGTQRHGASIVSNEGKVTNRLEVQVAPPDMTQTEMIKMLKDFGVFGKTDEPTKPRPRRRFKPE